MFELIKKGWIRCRYRFKLNRWIVQIWVLDDRTKSNIQAWSSKIRLAEKKSFLNIEAQIHEISNDNIAAIFI